MKSLVRLVRLTSPLSGMLLIAMMLAVPACTNTGGTRSAGAPAEISRERIAEIVASPDRTAGDRKNDARRKPAEVLAFIGVRPGMVALDLSAAGGYTTELSARAVGPTGRVYGQSAPQASPAPTRPTSPQLLMERAKNPVVANIIPVVRKFEEPIPPEVAVAGLDLVTLMFNYHDLGHMHVDRAQMNRAVYAALRPGGMYVIADHSGRPGTGISESGTLHRIEEAFLRQEVEAAGFKLAASGDFLRNPADPRDRDQPEPAQPKDEFILKFIKP
jgi:predicted methyltransferase